MIETLHPVIPLLLVALLLPRLQAGLRTPLLLLAPVLSLWLLWSIPAGVHLQVEFLTYSLEIMRVDKLSRLFATVFLIMTFTGGLFACRQASVVELCAALVYAAAAIAAVLAGDLMTLFVCWELMAVASTLVIWAAGTDPSRQAGMRYVLLHLLGGVLLMAGIAAQVSQTGSLAFEAMNLDGLASYLILAGFLLNAAAPPFSSWLADAYPEASASGSVFLSAFTTKTAVYVLLRGFPGNEILILVGLYMIFYGIIYALLENDMRRILAYSIVNQVGFMVCAAGIGTEMAINGASAHAFTHIIYKALLLMSAGSVLYMTGKRKCTDLGGLFQTMPLTAACGIIGALAISAFPLTSGFVSKSMITQASSDEHMMITWFLLQAASAGVFLHAGIKFPWFVFFQKDSGLRPAEPPWNMRLAMILFAALCLLIGLFPGPLYALLPYAVDYQAYTAEHVILQLQLLLFAGLAFFVMLPMMRRTLTISLDFDWFYRRFLPALLSRLAGLLHRSIEHSQVSVQSYLRASLQGFKSLFGIRSHLAVGSRSGISVLWVIIMLSASLLYYLI